MVTLTDEIAALNADMDSKKKDMQAATEIRDKEKADYKKTHTDYSESIEAVALRCFFDPVAVSGPGCGQANFGGLVMDCIDAEFSISSLI